MVFFAFRFSPANFAIVNVYESENRRMELGEKKIERKWKSGRL